MCFQLFPLVELRFDFGRRSVALGPQLQQSPNLATLLHQFPRRLILSRRRDSGAPFQSSEFVYRAQQLVLLC